MTYIVRVYMGDTLTHEKTVDKLWIAHKNGRSRSLQHHSEDYIEVWSVDTQTGIETLHSELRFGYDISAAMCDLRSYYHNCRPVMAGWEFYDTGFRLLVKKGYITQADNHLAHEAGYWELTPRFRKVGAYLRKRGWGKSS